MPKPTLAERLDALAALREPVRMRLYRYVERRLGAVGRDEAASAVGVSRAMAAFHLDKLVDLGLLRTEYRRLSGRTGRGAGRPAKLYRRSRRDFSVTLPKRDHELLARLLSGSLSDSDEPPRTDRAAHEYGRALGVRVQRGLSRRATPERLASCVEDVMEGIGFEPFRSRSGHVWSRNCPFDPLSRRYPDVICRTAVAMVRGVVEGVAAETVTVSREEREDRCCVVLDSPFARAPASPDASPKTAMDMR